MNNIELSLFKVHDILSASRIIIVIERKTHWIKWDSHYDWKKNLWSQIGKNFFIDYCASASGINNAACIGIMMMGENLVNWGVIDGRFYPRSLNNRRKTKDLTMENWLFFTIIGFEFGRAGSS